MVRFYENILGVFSDSRTTLRESYKAGRPMPKDVGLREAKQWLRNLEMDQARELLEDLEIGDSQQLGEGEAKITRGAGDARPFEHPFYWSAFVLIGAPD